MLCLVLGSWGAYAQHDHAKSDDKKWIRTWLSLKMLNLEQTMNTTPI